MYFFHVAVHNFIVWHSTKSWQKKKKKVYWHPKNRSELIHLIQHGLAYVTSSKFIYCKNPLQACYFFSINSFKPFHQVLNKSRKYPTVSSSRNHEGTERDSISQLASVLLPICSSMHPKSMLPCSLI